MEVLLREVQSVKYCTCVNSHKLNFVIINKYYFNITNINIYGRFLLPVTYFLPNLVYHFITL